MRTATTARQEIVALHDWMQEQLDRKVHSSMPFTIVLITPSAIVEEFRGDHSDRKPNPGMILRALSDLQIDKDHSFLVGDKDIDVQCARRAGIRGFRFTGGNVAKFIDHCVCSVEARAPRQNKDGQCMTLLPVQSIDANAGMDEG